MWQRGTGEMCAREIENEERETRERGGGGYSTLYREISIMRICNFNASPTCRSTATPSRRSRPSSTLLPSHSRPPLLLLGPFTSPSPPMERYNAPRQPLTRNNPIRQTELSASPFFISFFSLNSSFSTLDSSLFSLSLSSTPVHCSPGHCGDS